MKIRLAVFITAVLLAGILVFQVRAVPGKDAEQTVRVKVRPGKKGCMSIKCEHGNDNICCKDGKQAKCECSTVGEPHCYCQ